MHVFEGCLHVRFYVYVFVPMCISLASHLLFLLFVGYDQLSTYVQYEFPFPTAEPQKGNTSTIDKSANPSYKHVVKLR
jgi:hypothetical protein